MNKKRICIKKQLDKLSFYLVDPQRGERYLCSQRFSMIVYRFFSAGRTVDEILSFRHWRDNYRLSKTIGKLPLYIRYVEKYEFAEDEAPQPKQRTGRRTSRRTYVPQQPLNRRLGYTLQDFESEIAA